MASIIFSFVLYLPCGQNYISLMRKSLENQIELEKKKICVLILITGFSRLLLKMLADSDAEDLDSLVHVEQVSHSS